jgi:O-antigen polysaccharide polymerase Wzy
VRPEPSVPKPLFFMLWASIALFAIWETRAHFSDSANAATTGVLLVASLLLSRFVFGLPLTSGPMLYLALLGLFHLGLVLPWALGVYDISRAPWFSPYGLSRATAFVSFAIVAYQTGVATDSVIFRMDSRKRNDAPERNTEAPEVFFAGSLLLLGGAIMFVMGLVGLDPVNYFRLTYSETFRLRAETDPRFFGSGITLAFIGLSIAVAGASKRRLLLISLCGAAWLTGLMYWGFRGPALISAVIIYAIALKKGVKFRVWTPIVAVVLLLIGLPVMRLAREEPMDQRLVHISFVDFNALDGPVEMGASIRPLVETADAVGPGSYRHGKTYWIALKGVIPNVAAHWEAPETESLEDLPPSHWITAITDPWVYKNAGGMGFSAIAEPYMNFGPVGIVLYFFLLGFLLVRLEKISLHNAYALAAWALILGPLLWTTRNDFCNFCRPAIWGLLFLGAVRSCSRAYRFIPNLNHRADLPFVTKLSQ